MTQVACQIGRRGQTVLFKSGGLGIGLEPEAALLTYYAIKRLSKEAQAYDETNDDQATYPECIAKVLVVRRVGLTILLELQNRIWLEMPYQESRQVAGALYSKAQEIIGDRPKIAYQQIADQKLLFKNSFPVDITDDPRKIVAAAEAAGGIPSGARVGTPTITNHGTEAAHVHPRQALA